MYNSEDIKEILRDVIKGNTTCDAQTAENTLQYLSDSDVNGDRLLRDKTILQDKLSRRNMQIKELKKRIEELKAHNNTFGDKRD